MDRVDVLASDQRRKSLRLRLQNSVAVTKSRLRPSAIATRFVDKQRIKVEHGTRDAAIFLKGNAAWVVAGSLGMMLVAAAIPKLRASSGDEPLSDGDIENQD
jgi:hypothetical protein